MSRPRLSAGIWSAGTTTRLGLAVAGRERRVDDDVGGQQDLDAGLLRPLQVGPAGVELVLLEEALADLVALGLEEGEHHAAADEQLVGLAEQVVDDAELVGDLRAAEDHDVGPRGVDGQPAQHVDLGGHQAAHRGRQPQRHVVHGGLLAVHHPEPVGDERVGQVGQLPGERRPDLVVLAGLAAVEADVLQHRDLAVLEPGHRLVGALPHRVGGEGDVLAEQLTEPLGHRPQGVLRVGRAVGTAQVGDHDDAGALVGERLDRRHAGLDPPLVGDRAPVERDVQVRADQDPLAPDVAQVARSPPPGQRLVPTWVIRSARRLE